MQKLISRIPASWMRWAPLLLMLIFPVLGELYAIVNRLPAEVYTLITPIDDAIPFIPVFAVPYGVWIVFIYICVVYFFLKDRKSYYQAMVLYTISALTCYGIYLVFQTTVPRPDVIGNDIFSQIVRYIYNRDLPFNCFPSIHSFSSYMVMRLILKSPARNRVNVTLISGMTLLIIASTVFIKQHVVLDIVAAIVLVEFYILALYVLPAAFRSRAARQQARGLDF